MFPFLFVSRRDRAGESDGGGSTVAVDPGAPYEHGAEPAQEKVQKTAEKSDVEKRLEALESDLKAERKRVEELTTSERYWADRAKNGRAESDDEAGDADLSGDGAGEDDPDIDGDKLLDLVSTKGVKGLKEAGFVSRKDLKAAVNEAVAAAGQMIEGRAADVQLDMQLAREFPEIAEDAALIAKGQQPKSELYKRAAKSYQEMLALDPNLKKSGSTMILAARMAKNELAAEGKRVTDDKEDRQRTRRERIESQAGDRPARGSSQEGADDTPVVTEQAQQVMKNLGVSEQAFLKHAQTTTRAGGRRG